jgi:hypothetical protein
MRSTAASDTAEADGTTVRSVARGKTKRKPFPEHLPRERIVVPGPTACACSGSDRLAKIGEDIAARQQRALPLLNELEAWMQVERARLSGHADVAKTFDYMLTRWPAFTVFLRDGRICLTNNAAEWALRGIALSRKAWLFAGSDRDRERAAVIYSLIAIAKLNDVDPQARLADVLARIANQPIRRLDELLPWHWRQSPIDHSAAAA